MTSYGGSYGTPLNGPASPTPYYSQQNTSETSTSTSSSSTPKRSTWWIYLILLLVLAALAVGIIALFFPKGSAGSPGPAGPTGPPGPADEQAFTMPNTVIGLWPAAQQCNLGITRQGKTVTITVPSISPVVTNPVAGHISLVTPLAANLRPPTSRLQGGFNAISNNAGLPGSVHIKADGGIDFYLGAGFGDYPAASQSGFFGQSFTYNLQ